MKKLVIIGASGHGEIAADIAELNGYNEIVFLDDDFSKINCGKFPVVGNTAQAFEMDCPLFVAIGNSSIRKRITENLIRSEMEVITLIHPFSYIANTATIGYGSIIMAGAVVNPYTVLGNGCIVNTCASIDHDCKLSDYVHIAVGAHVCGSVSIGSETWIGAGGTIINNIQICNECLIGAGAVVTKDISIPGTYIGIPAKMKSIK